MTFTSPSHAEDSEQIERYKRIAHTLAERRMDPNLVDKVILTSTLSALIASIDQLDKTLGATADSDGDSDRNTRVIPKKPRTILEIYRDLREQRR